MYSNYSNLLDSTRRVYNGHCLSMNSMWMRGMPSEPVLRERIPPGARGAGGGGGGVRGRAPRGGRGGGGWRRWACRGGMPRTDRGRYAGGRSGGVRGGRGRDTRPRPKRQRGDS